mgnify:CR=1
MKGWGGVQFSRYIIIERLFNLHDGIISSPIVSAKVYYASLRVTNDAGRKIVLKPDKGNPDGFEINPSSTMEVTLMSMSTDGEPVQPVFFRAIDSETAVRFRINNKITPFMITPVENKKELNKLVVSVPRE